jgi:hypothetical protein
MSEIKKVKKPVNLNGEDFLLWHDDKVVEYGDLDSIKEYIADKIYLDSELTADDFQVTINLPLEGVTIEHHKEVTVEMNDDKYSEEYSYHIYKGGREVEDFAYESDALEWIAEHIRDGEGDEETYTLCRKVEYICTYDIEKDENVEINIPDQEVEVVEVEKTVERKPVQILTDEELSTQLVEMYARLQALHGEKERRTSSILKPGLMPTPLSLSKTE